MVLTERFDYTSQTDLQTLMGAEPSLLGSFSDFQDGLRRPRESHAVRLGRAFMQSPDCRDALIGENGKGDFSVMVNVLSGIRAG